MTTDTTPAAIEALMKDVTRGRFSVSHSPLLRVAKVDRDHPVVIAGVHKFGIKGGKAADGDPVANAHFIAWCFNNVPAIAAELATARAERDRAIAGWAKSLDDRIDALDRAEKANTELAALRKEVDRLRSIMGNVLDLDRGTGTWSTCHEIARRYIAAEPLGHGVTADDFGGEA